ncbi:hypothetical protein LguiA_021527 [Lonicera macranthoides]
MGGRLMNEEKEKKWRWPEKMVEMAVKATRKRAHKNIVPIEAKQRWKVRFTMFAHKILNFLGVEGNNSSSNFDDIFSFSLDLLFFRDKRKGDIYVYIYRVRMELCGLYFKFFF